MKTVYLIAILSSFLISLILVPLVIKFSNKKNLYDKIDKRKVHSGNISRLGGIAFTSAFCISLLLIQCFNGFVGLRQNILFLIPAALLISIMGIIDDIQNMRANKKLIIQCVAAVIVLFGDFKFTKLTLGSLNFCLEFGIFAYPITFLWIVGVINAINLIDGIDGQAGMLSVLITISYAFFFWDYGNYPAVIICFCLVAAITGFLVYNLPFPKAKIFMGDGGSQFLGFCLAVLPLLSSQQGSATIALPYATALLSIPIADIIATVWRRIREHRRINSPDKFHLHHKLMMMGFSSRGALIIVCILQCVISIFMCCAMLYGGITALMLLIAVITMVCLFFSIIHFQKTNIVNNRINYNDE